MFYTYYKASKSTKGKHKHDKEAKEKAADKDDYYDESKCLLVVSL